MIVLNSEPFLYSEVAKKIWLKNGFNYMEKTWAQIDSEDTYNNIDILIVRLSKRINFKVLKKFPDLKFIISATTGLDHIDLELIKNMNIGLISLREHKEFLKSIPSTAEHAWALIGALIRNITSANESVKNGEWNRDLFRGFQLKNKNIGIIGLGRVGKNIAKYAKAFEMNVGYYDPFQNSNFYRKYKTLEALLSESDIITLHVHLDENTIHLINATNLKFVKDGSYIINTSRGKIWDEDALCNVYKSGKIKGIATDVLLEEYENIQQSSIWKLHNSGANIIITPHIGGATFDAMWLCEEFLASYFLEKNINISKSKNSNNDTI